MLHFRAKTLEKQHHQWSQLTNEWHADVPDSSLWSYVLREGITHQLAVNDRDAAKRRLSDLMFSGTFLDWCYKRLADDCTPLLKIWRVLGIDEAREHYQRAVPALTITHPSQLLLLRHWISSVLKLGWQPLFLSFCSKLLLRHRQSNPQQRRCHQRHHEPSCVPTQQIRACHKA